MAWWLLPAILSAAGAGMQIHAQQQAAQREREAINRQFENKTNAQQQQAQALMEGTRQYAPETRQAALTESEQTATDRLMAILAERSPLAAGVSGSTGGNTGSDYALATGAATSAATDKAQKLARLMGRAGGLSELQAREGRRLGQAENKAMQIGNMATGQAMVDDASIRQAGVVNPWLQFAGSAMQGAGMGRLSMGADGKGVW